MNRRRFQRGFCARRNRGAIQDATVALVIFFHAARGGVFYGSGQILKDGSRFLQFHGRECDDRVGGGRFGQGFTRQQMFGEQFARRKKFRCGPAGFADGGIVIVAGSVGFERAVATGPQTERGAAVRHVDAERRAHFEHQLQVG